MVDRTHEAALPKHSTVTAKIHQDPSEHRLPEMQDGQKGF